MRSSGSGESLILKARPTSAPACASRWGTLTRQRDPGDLRSANTLDWAWAPINWPGATVA